MIFSDDDPLRTKMCEHPLEDFLFLPCEETYFDYDEVGKVRKRVSDFVIWCPACGNIGIRFYEPRESVWLKIKPKENSSSEKN